MNLSHYGFTPAAEAAARKRDSNITLMIVRTEVFVPCDIAAQVCVHCGKPAEAITFGTFISGRTKDRLWCWRCWDEAFHESTKLSSIPCNQAECS